MQNERIIKYIGNIEDDSLIDGANMIVICGFGEKGKRVYEYLTKEYNSIVLCDALEVGDYQGKKIVSYSDIDRYLDAVFLVTNLDIRDTVYLLKRSGINNIHVITR